MQTHVHTHDGGGDVTAIDCSLRYKLLK